MLKDVTQGSFTKKKIHLHPHYGVWYVYIPPTEEDFREKALKIVRNFASNKIGIRIASINAALKYIEAKTTPVNFESTEEDWVEAHWILYKHNFIDMAYSKERPDIFQMFARPTESRKRNLVKH